MKNSRRLPPPLLDEYEWQDRGLCRTMSVATFFDLETQAAEEAAKRVCRGCPVIEKCLSHALAAEDHGVWGGLTGREREVMRMRRAGMAVRAS